MSRKVRIIISCLFVVLAFGAGIFAYAHTYGDRANLANAVTSFEDEFLVDKDGWITVPDGGWTTEARANRGTAANPFFILEIVPYEGIAKMGFFISGEEPIDVEAAARDGLDIPGGTSFYDYEYGVPFYFWEDEKPTTDKWQSITPSKTNQYGTMTRVENGMGDYKRVETVDADNNPVVTYVEDFNGNFEWAPLTIEECLALGEDGETEYNEINNAADIVGAQVKIYFEDVEYVTASGNKVTHKNTFLKRSVGLMYDEDENGRRIEVSEAELNERLESYTTKVISVTPEDLNRNPDLVRRADLIVFTPFSEFIASTGGTLSINGIHTTVLDGESLRGADGKIKNEYKYIPYLQKEKVGYEDPTGQYGRKNNVAGATFETNQLDWEIALLIYERATDPEWICPIVTDYKAFNETRDDNTKSVDLKKRFENGTYATESITGTQNNIVKLYLMMSQMRNPVFESFYGEVTTTSHPMFSSVPMKDSSGNVIKKKDGNNLTTGVFLYDKDWPAGDKASDDDSRIYWGTKTLLPWSLLPNSSGHDNPSTAIAAMKPYEIMIEGEEPYNLTSNSAQNGIRNGILTFHGDNKMGTSFDLESDPCLVKNNQYGAELYEYFDSILQPEDCPTQEGDLTMADCLNYLLHYVNQRQYPIINTDKYRILELQPSPDYESKTNFWAPYMATHLNTVNPPEVTQMTTSEFIGSRVDCMAAYDLIYIGVKKFSGSNDPMMDFSGTDDKFGHGIDTDYIYAHTGPKVTVTTQTYSWTQENFKGMYGWLGTTEESQEKYFVYSGNDLTLLAYDKLKEYGAEGFPILFGSGFYTNTGVSSVVSKIDRNSYVYKLGTSVSNRFNCDAFASFTDSSELRELMTVNSRKVDFYFASASDYPLLYDDDTSKSDGERYINGSNINNRELKFTFKVLGPAGTTYRLKLFVDSNTDGIYKPGEEDLGVTVRKADDTIAAGGVVEAGGTYTVRRTINDRIGSICWKLALVENNSNEAKVYASFSGVSAIKDNPSDTTDNDDILVLQIVPDSMTPSLLLPTSKADAESLGGASEEFYNLVNVEDTDGDGVKDSINGMKISFVRMDQDEVWAAIKGSGSDDAPEHPNYLKDTYDMLVLGFADRYDGVSDAKVIAKIDEFIAAGKAVLYTHDGASVIGEDGGIYKPLSKTITETFRDKFGMDRYGALNNVAPDNIEEGDVPDIPYIPESGSDTGKIYKTGTKNLVQGLTNGMLWRTYYSQISGDDSDRNINATQVTRVNVGAITEYPYNIPTTIEVATTHPQVYQLDMEEEDMVVWYTLTGGTGASSYENQYYGASPKDVRNNYYIYNKANITYTGMGHDLGAFSMTVDEIKLFVNTFIAAYRAAAKPVDVQVVNDDVTVNYAGEQFLCVEVDSSDAANVIGDLTSADISETYRKQVYDSATSKFVQDELVTKKSKRVYFKLVNSNSYGSDSTTYDVKIKLNDGNMLDGVQITGEIGDEDDTSDDSMLAVYEAATGDFVDGSTVKYVADGTGGFEHIYYVDVPIITDQDNALLSTRAVATTKVTISVTMSYTYSESADPITITGDDQVYIMPRGLFDLD